MTALSHKHKDNKEIEEKGGNGSGWEKILKIK
jgi:hypothetical protein